MNKLTYTITFYMTLLLAFGFNFQPTQAATPLPASNWYAITWVRSTDTLHWVNANGEQAHMTRPKLTNEIENSATLRMEISPNGQHMVLIANLQNGNLGVGFYDFVTGQFVQQHEAQPNEALSLPSKLAFSFTGSHVAMALRNTVSQEWRVLVFESATGNAVDQITRTSTILPDTFITDPSWWPIITHFSVDEGIGQSFVGLQTITNNPSQLTFPSFNWYHNPVPAVANTPIVPASLPFSPFAGHDVLATTKAVTFAGFNEQEGAPLNNLVGNFIGTHMAANVLPVPVVNSGGYTVNSPQWLNNGAWIGYRVQNNVQQSHYAITSAQNDTSIPFGPNIGAIHSTTDGFVAVNVIDWQLYHTTDLNMDAFAYQFGNTVFQSNNLPFSVIYTTPEGTFFSLQSLPVVPNVELGGNEQVQAPVEPCGTAPAPRLTVGENARVTFTTGSDLNIRTAADGDYIMQIAEGTVVSVVNGPVCANNYRWWHVQFENLGATVGGWAAEGDSNDYFLEPFETVLGDPLQFVPTATPLVLQIATTQPDVEVAPPLGFAPTNTPELNIAPPVAVVPTNTPELQIKKPLELVPTATPLVLQANCYQSPASQLQVGMKAKTVDLDGTLAMRTNLTDATPTYQVPAQKNVTILAGPQCREGIRMWQVSTKLNGQEVVGWIAEGFGNNYYMLPK